MSKFHNQLALVSVSVLALTAGAVGLAERAADRAERAAEAQAQAAEQERLRTEAEAALTQAAAEAAQAEAAQAETAQADAAADVAADLAQAESVDAGTGATADEVAQMPVAPAAEDANPQDAPEDPVVAAEVAPTQGHGDAGTSPIGSILAGVAVAQSVDSPAIEQTAVRYGLGREALPEEIAAWDIDVRPDGTGLPDGSGDVWTGEEVFIENCAVCHGDFAEGVGRWPVLAGGIDTLTRDRPIKTIGSYWPYLSTVWDYVYRAMPFGYAQSLEPDQVYAITAYLLYSNGIVEDDFVLSRENFTEVRLPNEDNFFMDDRAEGELQEFSAEPCMVDCKESVEVTMRAAMLDVTPDVEGSATQAAVIETPGQDAGATDTGAADATDTEANASEDATEVDAPTEMASAETSETAIAAAASAPDPELVAAGERAFRQCSTCHQVGEDASNRVGPQLNGVLGRTAGSVDGFRYSSVMADAGAEGLVWTEETLHDFLTEPRNYLKGTRMSFSGFRNEDDIAAVTAYLSTYSE